MSNDVDLVVDDLLSQLKGASAASKELNKEEFKLDKEELESFLLNYSGKLIKGTVDYVEEVKQFITSAPDSRDVDALSKLVGASASAIESLNKILLQDKANEAKIHVKELDIQSKKELQEKSNERLGLTINREELLKQLVDDAKIIEVDLELEDEWKLDLSKQTKTIQLHELDSEIEKILNGLQLGRVVIKHGD